MVYCSKLPPKYFTCDGRMESPVSYKRTQLDFELVAEGLPAKRSKPGVFFPVYIVWLVICASLCHVFAGHVGAHVLVCVLLVSIHGFCVMFLLATLVDTSLRVCVLLYRFTTVFLFLLFVQVERRNWVKVEALNAKGKKVKKKYTDWTARIFQVSLVSSLVP